MVVLLSEIVYVFVCVQFERRVTNNVQGDCCHTGCNSPFLISLYASWEAGLIGC